MSVIIQCSVWCRFYDTYHLVCIWHRSRECYHLVLCVWCRFYDTYHLLCIWHRSRECYHSVQCLCRTGTPGKINLSVLYNNCRVRGRVLMCMAYFVTYTPMHRWTHTHAHTHTCTHACMYACMHTHLLMPPTHLDEPPCNAN